MNDIGFKNKTLSSIKGFLNVSTAGVGSFFTRDSLIFVEKVGDFKCLRNINYEPLAKVEMAF